MGRWQASSSVREARKTSVGVPNLRSNFPVRREPRPGVIDSESQSREASSSTQARRYYCVTIRVNRRFEWRGLKPAPRETKSGEAFNNSNVALGGAVQDSACCLVCWAFKRGGGLLHAFELNHHSTHALSRFVGFRRHTAAHKTSAAALNCRSRELCIFS